VKRRMYAVRDRYKKSGLEARFINDVYLALKAVN